MRTFFCSLAALALFFACILYVQHALSATLETDRGVVTIVPGESVGQIAKNLKEARLISSPRTFVFVSFLSGRAHKLRPGRYIFTGKEGVFSILNTLASGPRSERVVIPEGSTLKDIDLLLAEREIAEAGSLTSFSFEELISQYPFLEKAETLEGYLFPDTYDFEAGESVEQIVSKFLDTFSKKALPLLSEYELTNVAMRDVLTTASILEKEVTSFEDRRLVAGILKKRIALKMPLQVDATVIYGKCGTFKNCALLRTDFSSASPFNTYTRLGLPPHPIGNPGVEAMRAALSPKTSSYLYYLSQPETGKTIFSKTFEEHDTHRATYLR